MRNHIPIMLGAWLALTAAAVAEDLPDGTFASTAEGCERLKESTAAELGEDLDFYVLSREGITAHLQRCDFAEVTPRGDGRWLATAFCDEDGYVYPDIFAIARTDMGGLAVTRVTDLTQQGSPENESPESFVDDMDPVELGRDPVESDEEPAPEETVAVPKPDAFNQFVLCPDVKQ